MHKVTEVISTKARLRWRSQWCRDAPNWLTNNETWCWMLSHVTRVQKLPWCPKVKVLLAAQWDAGFAFGYSSVLDLVQHIQMLDWVNIPDHPSGETLHLEQMIHAYYYVASKKKKTCLQHSIKARSSYPSLQGATWNLKVLQIALAPHVSFNPSTLLFKYSSICIFTSTIQARFWSYSMAKRSSRSPSKSQQSCRIMLLPPQPYWWLW